jgi:tripartite-type tricarboxylate transporter receptor subunit TctC
VVRPAGPGQISQAHADNLSAAAVKAVRGPAAAKLLENDAAIPIPIPIGSAAAEFAAFIPQEQKRWKPVIERARIKPE